jgi:hypothetical protein
VSAAVVGGAQVLSADERGQGEAAGAADGRDSKDSGVEALKTGGVYSFGFQRGCFLWCSLWGVLIAAFLCCVGSQGQDSTRLRQVNVDPLNKYAPIEVLSVSDGNKTIPNPFGPYQYFRFDDSSASWIANLSIRLQNQSPKEITAVEIAIEVPSWRTTASEPRYVITFHDGFLPSEALIDSDGGPIAEESSSPLNIPPGKASDLSLTASLPQWSSYASRKGSMDDVDLVVIRLRRIFFGDGTMWVTNTYEKPDPHRPGNYIPITAAEFAGTK